MQFFEACALGNQWVKLWFVYGSGIWVTFTPIIALWERGSSISLAFQLLESGMSVLPGVDSKITTTPSSFGISFQNLNENALV